MVSHAGPGHTRRTTLGRPAPRRFVTATGLSMALLLSGFLVSCGEPVTESIDVTGSSSIAPLAADVARDFEERFPSFRVDVQTGGSSRGIADVRQGVAAIGMVSRSLLPSESDLHAFAVASDGIGIIAHANNPVAELSHDQVRRLFLGRVPSWSELGGQSLPVSVVTKAAGRSTLEVFCQYFDLAAEEIDAAVVIGDNQQGIKAVAASDGAIGYVSIGAAESAIQRGVPIRLLRFDGVVPSTRALREGRYPISRTLHLVTVADPTGLARDYIDFFRSEAAHSFIRRHHLVPIDPP